MKMTLSPSGSHCKSFLVTPSVVSCFSSEPSTFMSQISLLATKAILSAPPGEGSAGTAVSVGARGGISVLVASTIATGTSVELSTGADVSVAGGTGVDVLTGGSVTTGCLLPLNRNKPVAKTATTPTGIIINSALNPFF